VVRFWMTMLFHGGTCWHSPFGSESMVMVIEGL
jgi:hypothetical protein